MNCIDEIINRLEMEGRFSADNLRIILSDYAIERKSAELAVVSENKDKALKMFFVTKKVEGCSDNTIRYYVGVLRRFFSEIKCDLDQITSDRIRYYIAIRSQRDKLGKVSQDNELRVLKSFFGWCTAEDYISKNPTLNIKPIKKEKRLKTSFSEIELEMLRKSAVTKRDTAVIETLFSTGCRVSEFSSEIGRQIVFLGRKTAKAKFLGGFRTPQRKMKNISELMIGDEAMIFNIICDNCKAEFKVDNANLLKAAKDDIEVQYFECPDCRRKYMVIVIDSKMRELINHRQLLTSQISLARRKHFRKSTINGYIAKMEKLKAEQIKLSKQLEPIGKKILVGDNEDRESGTDNDTMEIEQASEPERTDPQD